MKIWLIWGGVASVIIYLLAIPPTVYGPPQTVSGWLGVATWPAILGYTIVGITCGCHWYRKSQRNVDDH